VGTAYVIPGCALCVAACFASTCVPLVALLISIDVSGGWDDDQANARAA
jgi:hypothetical protein